MAFGVSLTADGDGLFEDFLAEPIVLG
jgi:hypothetical protein